MYTSGWCHELAARGISTLMVDCPGSGEALRFLGLKARVETEDWAKACVDYLETRSDVDPDRVGLAGWSLGGYYAPRAAAFEKRLKLVVAWGARPWFAFSDGRAGDRGRQARAVREGAHTHDRRHDGVPHPRHAVPRAVSSRSVLCVIHG